MSLSRINTVLLVLIVLINGYIIASPFVPRLRYNLAQSTDNKQQLEKLLVMPPPGSDATSDSATAHELIIPSILLRQQIHDVRTTSDIRDDVWRRPNTSTPEKGGNTVLVGHRFTYSNPSGVFYHIDKISLADEIAVSWEGIRYLYKVSDIRIVAASETSVEDNTSEPRLTIYSCTPLWNPTQRLVISATLERTIGAMP